MNRLSWGNNRWKFKTAGKLPTILKGFIEYTPNFIKENRRMSTCNWLHLQTLGCQPVMSQNLLSHRTTGKERSPHKSFILNNSQISALQFKGWFKTSIQEYRNETQNSYSICAWIIWYMFPVQCEELRINHLTLLLVVTMSYACWFLWQAKKKKKKKEKLRPYIVPAWMRARYPNAKHGWPCCSMRSYASVERWPLVVGA